jgi:hypothetical protein
MNSNIILTISDFAKQVGIFDIKLINVDDFLQLLIRIAFNLLAIYIIVFFLYAKNSRRKDFYFSYFAIGITIFTLCFLLESVKVELGFALGLFAIFGIIRYRTDAIPIKEMTYLFVVIGVSVVNALSSKMISFLELIFTNSAIILTLWILEKILMLKQEGSLKITYEKIENIHSQKSDELLRDLEERTGIKVKRYEIEQIDFLKDICKIRIFYDINEYSPQNKSRKDR